MCEGKQRKDLEARSSAHASTNPLDRPTAVFIGSRVAFLLDGFLNSFQNSVPWMATKKYFLNSVA